MAPLTTASAPLVLKFGGSAFLDPSGYGRVADYVASRLADAAAGAVVVVSAMSGTTGKLQETLHTVNATPPPAVTAMMLTSGEQVSVALLVAAFNARDVPAVGLPAAKLGFLAEGPADRARLFSIEPGSLLKALESAPVVVVPGGQAIEAGGAVVMLGRNSSDLSAVAAAVAVRAEVCERFSDVPGVCSADPYLVPGARTLPLVDYDTMGMLAASGAKVIQGQAVHWAREHRIAIKCHSLPPAAVCETVVTRAAPTVALVLHEMGEVWLFDAPEERARAADRLASQGLDSLVVPHEEALLAVTGYGRPDLVESCCEGGVRRPELCLLTALDAAGQADHAIVPRADGVAELRRRHDLYYARDDLDQPVGPVKLRSDRSGLLIGD